MLCESVFMKVQSRARSGWLLETGQWSPLWGDRGPQAPGAVNVPIAGLGAGGTEGFLGPSPVPTTHPPSLTGTTKPPCQGTFLSVWLAHLLRIGSVTAD